jgi:predicted transcriptional regulator
MTSIMSFWPSIYEKISSQTKIIEYRRTFPKECDYAYMYVSKPVKAICGIIYFGNKYSLEDWKNEYSTNLEVSNRIHHYLESYRFAMEIKGFQRIEPISLKDLRENVPNFVAPQSYLLLENNKLLSNYVKNNTILVGKMIENDFADAFPEHVCLRY